MRSNAAVHGSALLVLLAAGAVSTGLGACGDDGRTGAQPGAASAPQPASAAGRFAGTGELSPGDVVRERGEVTYTPLARYSGRVAISRRQGYLAVAVGGPDELELRISRAGGVPSPARGAGPIPVWAQIHVGIDEGTGMPVVAYPRCDGPELGSCDLYVWSESSKTERKVEGASAPGVAETEGVVDTGDVLFAVERDPSATQEQLRFGEYARPTTLMLRRDAAAARRVAARGGRRLVLSGNTLGDVLGACGAGVRLFDGGGRETFHDGAGCGFNEAVAGVGTSLETAAFFFARAKSDGAMTVYRFPLGRDRSALQQASLGMQAVDWAASSPSSGYAVSGAGCDGRFEDPADVKGSCLVTEVEGLELR